MNNKEDLISSTDTIFFSISILFTLNKFELMQKFLGLSLIKSFKRTEKNIRIIEEQIKEKYNASNVKIDIDSNKIKVKMKYELAEYDSKLVDVISSLENILLRSNNRVDRTGIKNESDNMKKIHIIVKPDNKVLKLNTNLKRAIILDCSLVTLYSGPNRYINKIVILPEVPSISIIRILYKSENKIDNTESKSIIIKPIRFAKNESEIYKFNNFIISNKNSQNDDSIDLQKNIFDLYNIEDTLLFTSLGIISKDKVIIPWPFSSFQLASDSDTIYTLFLGKFKIEENKEYNKDNKEYNKSNSEIMEINYSNELVMLNLSVNAITINNNKLTRIPLRVYALKGLLKFGSDKIGIFLTKAFNVIDSKENQIYFLKVLEDSKTPEINNVRKQMLNDPDLFNTLKNILNENNALRIKRFIIDYAYQNSQGILRLKGSDDLIKFYVRLLRLYGNIYKDLFRYSLEPNSIINTF
jgi:hypothetical protein